ncbi:PH domain-containing protein [Anaerorhabdus sp.]|uniref:PH domain-containing protein n=1 Tax=Anaerorhabdus sp. TaxID=1872524 RepID=UPI002B21D11F|nr:PH domain-containing protein [Anaerorhabdus sp.]MEA4875593.1 PH domain-containing protein [Anaerorhabdus sp.]
MSEKTNSILPIVSVVIRYLCSFACIAIGVFICLGGTNSYVGATMAFSCAVLVSPLLDSILKALNLRLGVSYRAVLVIITVFLDIFTSQMKYWILINVGVVLVFFIIFIVLSNLNRDKYASKYDEEEIEDEPEVVKPIKKQKPKKESKLKSLFLVEEEDEDEEDEEDEELPPLPKKQRVQEPIERPMAKPITKAPIAQPQYVDDHKTAAGKFTIFEEVEEPKKEKRIELLNSPEAMLEYAIQHGYGQGADDNLIKSCFNLILASLKPDEKVLICFMGNNFSLKTGANEGYYGYAITTKRLIFARKGFNGQTVQAISLSKIEKVSVKKGTIEGVLRVHTASGTLSIGMDNDTCLKVGARIQRFADEIARLKMKLATSKKV